jgi:hypothetical protein
MQWFTKHTSELSVTLVMMLVFVSLIAEVCAHWQSDSSGGLADNINHYVDSGGTQSNQ